MLADMMTDMRKHCRQCARTDCIEKGGAAALRFFLVPGECWNFKRDDLAATALPPLPAPLPAPHPAPLPAPLPAPISG